MGSLVVSTNVQGLNAHRALKITSDRTEKASEKLSSGYKINRAGDDAAGLAISEKMRNQVKGLNMASKNSADGISMIQTAEGALQETHEMLKRMRELVVQGTNDTNISTDRHKIGLEMEALTNEIDETAKKTEYNTKKLINGDVASAATGGPTKGQIYLKVGANSNQKIQIGIDNMDATALSLKADFQASKIRTTAAKGFDALLKKVDSAISTVSTMRAKLGATQNRLEHTIKNLDTSAENLAGAESRIRDTDMAAAMMEFTKSNILSQAGMSMLSQANQAPNNVLSIVR